MPKADASTRVTYMLTKGTLFQSSLYSETVSSGTDDPRSAFQSVLANIYRTSLFWRRRSRTSYAIAESKRSALGGCGVLNKGRRFEKDWSSSVADASIPWSGEFGSRKGIAETPAA
ncbi:hypothetical protein TNCV_4241521 [Trichonephila clavipes]|nr:hypothetical protein TNCV_4241521 [Trichonephila clavipes]